MTIMRVLAILIALSGPCCALAAELSPATSMCLECHRTATPGAVADWERSRHAQVTLAEALAKPALGRRVSFTKSPKGQTDVAVGCAECHTINPREHKDTFKHEGYQVHVVVTPKDCATCHPTEVEQYGHNLMSHAYGNLNKNPVYHDLMNLTNGVPTYENMKVVYKKPDAQTGAESCNYCHGTVVGIKGTKSKDTDFGQMKFPVLTEWPNQGVGRINPDGSAGSCTACHTRHQFSIQMARKPYTCAECHKGPDVPAYKVYEVSKHGNIFSSLHKEWDFNNVPWTVGKDFTAPTCAACHASLIVTEDGDMVAERTHRMNDRLPWRLLGLIYAHPHPKSPDTTVIKNKAGLALPTELTGEPAVKYLIDAQEREKRRTAMWRVCLACHHDEWVEGQWARLENTIRTTNESTLAATKIILAAWDTGLAKGLANGDSIFNESIEKKWVEHWLFFANSTRFSSAMAGADYGVFAHGRWYMNKNIQEMIEWMELRGREATSK
jgi:hydroxylamine dehydrogenase